MQLDLLVRFYNDLTSLDPSVPTVVQYDNENGLLYRQLGKVVAVSYLGSAYFPNPPLELGILTPKGYSDLMDGLKRLIEDPQLKDDELGIRIKNYGTEFYKCYNRGTLSGPQLYIVLDYVSITNSFISKWVLKNHNPESKTLLKALINESKHSKKLSKGSK